MIAQLKKSRQPFRFVIAGAINTIFGLGFYPLLLWIAPMLRVHYMIALAISYVVCLTFAYVTYKFGVFRTRGNVPQEFSAFLTFYALCFIANLLVLPLLVEVVGLLPLIAQTGFSLAIMISSYFWHSQITFARSGSHR